MLTGKGEKARIRLQAINNDIEMINDKLNDLRTILLKVVNNKIDKFVHPGSIFLGDLKHRSMIKNIPNRIEFEFNRLRFFIDFTLVTSESYDQVEIAGSIIYGANRTLCFLD